MRVVSTFLLLCIVAIAQEQKVVWERVYTGDDSVIEMNVSKITFGGKNIGRVRYRTTYDNPQLIKSSQLTYKTRNETLEFKCADKLYRVYESSLLDAQGHEIDSYEQDLRDEWRPIKPGGMMEKLSYAGCRLISQHQPSPPAAEPRATLKKRVRK
jgi:hypothetical protein